MKLIDIMDKVGLKAQCCDSELDKEVSGGYCGDLLSDVMANSKKGQLWLTVQSHQNIVAVAVLRELAAIILVNGRLPDEETKRKAEIEKVPILTSPLTAFELAGRLFKMGVGSEGN